MRERCSNPTEVSVSPTCVSDAADDALPHIRAPDAQSKLTARPTPASSTLCASLTSPRNLANRSLREPFSASRARFLFFF